MSRLYQGARAYWSPGFLELVPCIVLNDGFWRSRVLVQTALGGFREMSVPGSQLTSRRARLEGEEALEVAAIESLCLPSQRRSPAAWLAMNGMLTMFAMLALLGTMLGLLEDPLAFVGLLGCALFGFAITMRWPAARSIEGR